MALSNEKLLCQESIKPFKKWLTQGSEEQKDAFVKGFDSVIPEEWVRCFNTKELELLVCGIQEINVDDWKKYTIYRHYSKKSKQVIWFWQASAL